ncbi:CBS domain-containing protein [Deltaproteobacteria bacterium TL4]
MATIKSIMTEPLIVAQPDESVAVVVKRMKENQLGAILLLDQGQLYGIFSERDLLNRVVAENKDVASTKIKEVATMDLVVIQENTPIKDCVRLIKNNGFGHLPVVDAQNVPKGMISSRDFLQYMVSELENLIDEAIYNEQLTEGIDPYDFIDGCTQF